MSESEIGPRGSVDIRHFRGCDVELAKLYKVVQHESPGCLDQRSVLRGDLSGRFPEPRIEVILHCPRNREWAIDKLAFSCPHAVVVYDLLRLVIPTQSFAPTFELVKVNRLRRADVEASIALGWISCRDVPAGSCFSILLEQSRVPESLQSWVVEHTQRSATHGQ